MSCFLFTTDEESSGKVNIDELFEKNQRRDLKQVSIFNKILNRIHRRITQTGRNRLNDKHIWFTVPEYIFGEPVYDNADCIAYVVAKLESNGFSIKYVHPNTLFVSWSHWVPSYVRSEFKKRTGKIVSSNGIITDPLADDEDVPTNPSDDANSKILNSRTGIPMKLPTKTFTPVAKYKPTGNLVYNPEYFEKLEKKVSFEK